MKPVKHIQLFITTLIVSGYVSLQAQTCIDFNDFTSPISHYNDPVTYPDRSVLYEVGDIKFKNGNDASHPFNPTVLDSIKSGYIPFGERLFLKAL